MNSYEQNIKQIDKLASRWPPFLCKIYGSSHLNVKVFFLVSLTLLIHQWTLAQLTSPGTLYVGLLYVGGQGSSPIIDFWDSGLLDSL